MYTSFISLALAGFLLAPSPSAPTRQEPVWWRDYQVALTKGANEGKPLAVFVGAGYGGYHAVAREGELNDSIKKVLAESFVCVYLDTASPSQARLIQSFALTTGKGLVISNRTGTVQALHFDGVMAEAELAKHLNRFADPNVDVRVTLTNANQRTSYYGSPYLRSPGYASGYSGASC